jgi:23S rRNA (guanosine2251-2'-O)-methyltransferase
MAEHRWGFHVVREALRAGSAIDRVWLEQGWEASARLRELAALARRRGFRVDVASQEELDQLAGSTRHQGVVVAVPTPRYSGLDDILRRADEQGEPLLALALDGVQDPHNLGAILRTADATAAHGVIIPQHGAAGVTDVVARTSAGASAYVPVVRVTNLARELVTLKQGGVWLYGLDAAGATDYDRADYDRSLVLVVGGEGRGLRRLVRETCDLLIRLPTRGHVESMNVSVATSVVLYHAWRAREAPMHDHPAN